ncbi:MAG TPA: hypothetical protein VEX86_00580 [Longimicrobium sp.]|nr:hypothetical protein [Longimicrobium sp.]
MPEIIAAMDEPAVSDIMAVAVAQAGTLGNGGSTSFGPFTASYGASATFSGGSVKLFTPNVVQIANLTLNYTVSFNLSFDLSSIIPNFYFPGVKVKIFKKWFVIIPAFTIDWPTVTIPVSYSDKVTFSANFALQTTFDGTSWHVKTVILGMPALQIGPAASAILVLIGAAAGPVLLAVPFIGLAGVSVVGSITTALGISGVTNLLHLVLNPFLAGRTFELYNQPKHFQLLPAVAPVSPPVFINLTSVAAAVVNNGEPELELSVDIAP